MFICKEKHSWPLHYLMKDINKKAKSISAFFIMPHEALLDHEDYKKFKKINSGIDIFDTSRSAKKYIKSVKENKFNLNHKYYERKISKLDHYKSFGEHLASSQILMPNIHGRNYYKGTNWKNLLYFIQEYLTDIEDVLVKFKPDLILDVDLSEYGRSFILELSKKMKIPYLTLLDGRFGGYMMISSSLNLKADEQFVKKFDNNLIYLKKNKLERSVKIWLNKIQSKSIITTQSYKENYNKAKITFISPFFVLFNQLKQFVKSVFKTKFFLFHRSKYAPVVSDPKKRLTALFIECFRKLLLKIGFIFEYFDIRKENYILVHLQVSPESSTLTLSPFYIDELHIIKSLSKSIDYNQKILVKEHWGMLGERSFKFYKEIKKIPNAVLISPFLYENSKEVIYRSDGVVTISGTVGLEAIGMGKNCAIFSHTPFNLIRGIDYVNNIRDLPKIIKSWKKRKPSDLHLAAYIKTVIDCGEQLKHEFLLHSDRMNIHERNKQIRNLKNLFNRYLQDNS